MLKNTFLYNLQNLKWILESIDSKSSIDVDLFNWMDRRDLSLMVPFQNCIDALIMVGTIYWLPAYTSQY